MVTVWSYFTFQVLMFPFMQKKAWRPWQKKADDVKSILSFCRFTNSKPMHLFFHTIHFYLPWQYRWQQKQTKPSSLSNVYTSSSFLCFHPSHLEVIFIFMYDLKKGRDGYTHRCTRHGHTHLFTYPLNECRTATKTNK